MKKVMDKIQGAEVCAGKSVKNEATKVDKIEKIERAKIERENQKTELLSKASEKLGTKTVNGKEILPSKKLVKYQSTIIKFEGKENRTLNETKLLVNALSKMENLSASKLYARMIAKTELNTYFIELCGGKTLPTFKQFADKLPVKFLFSEWDVLGVLIKINPKHKLSKKIEAQNKATKAK